MDLIKNDKVGEGGSWRVFQCETSDKRFGHPLILKLPKGGSRDFIEKHVYNYEQIKNLGLPTLSMLRLVSFEDNFALLGEYLNTDGWLFVSPNCVIRDIDRAVNLNAKGTQVFEKEPIAEKKLYDRKLSGIIHFQHFLNQSVKDIKTASKANYEIYFDSYFFGVKEHEPITIIQYKIGDFDQIFYKPNVPEKALFDYNMEEFKQAIDEFIQYFIITSNQSLYLDMTSKTLSSSMLK